MHLGWLLIYKQTSYSSSSDFLPALSKASNLIFRLRSDTPVCISLQVTDLELFLSLPSALYLWFLIWTPSSSWRTLAFLNTLHLSCALCTVPCDFLTLTALVPFSHYSLRLGSFPIHQLSLLLTNLPLSTICLWPSFSPGDLQSLAWPSRLLCVVQLQWEDQWLLIFYSQQGQGHICPLGHMLQDILRPGQHFFF